MPNLNLLTPGTHACLYWRTKAGTAGRFDPILIFNVSLVRQGMHFAAVSGTEREEFPSRTRVYE